MVPDHTSWYLYWLWIYDVPGSFPVTSMHSGEWSVNGVTLNVGRRWMIRLREAWHREAWQTRTF